MLQVIPLVEAFFVLCDVCTAHQPPLDNAVSRQVSLDLGALPFAASMDVSGPSSSRQSAHGGPSGPPAQAQADPRLPFLR